MPATPATETPPIAPAVPRAWSKAARGVVSLLLAWHIVALFVGPLSVPRSILGDFLRRAYQPYLEVAYLNHAYKFFAPDPGPSHLVRYTLEMADGSKRQGTFPDLRQHQPRLRYHRHFMLSEFIAGFPPSEKWDPRTTPWEKQPVSAEQARFARSYATHLLATHNAQRVTLRLVEHGIPTPDEMLKGATLDAKASYVSRPLGAFTGDAP